MSAKYSVLILDDSSDYQRILKRILGPAGFRVYSALSAEEAEQLLETRIPDVALVDWSLPGMSGVEFSKKIRQDSRFSRMILIMLTVKSQPEDQVVALRRGAVNMFMTKPVSAGELLARIESLIKKREELVSGKRA